MKAYVGAALLGCMVVACSQDSKRSFDPSKSPRTGAYQDPGQMQPASRTEEDSVVVEREVTVEEEPGPSDPLMEPMQQGDSVADQRTTQRIRQALEDDDSLSFTAKNVKVVTLRERVTLRGPVESMDESQRVEAHAKRIAGPENVVNQLEVEAE